MRADFLFSAFLSLQNFVTSSNKINRRNKISLCEKSWKQEICTHLLTEQVPFWNLLTDKIAP